MSDFVPLPEIEDNFQPSGPSAGVTSLTYHLLALLYSVDSTVQPGDTRLTSTELNGGSRKVEGRTGKVCSTTKCQLRLGRALVYALLYRSPDVWATNHLARDV